MKVFISHSISETDQPILDQLVKVLRASGIEPYVAERNVEIGSRITDKIERAMDACEAAVVLLSQHGSNSFFVANEIGYLRRAGKMTIPLVEDGLSPRGLLYGIDFIPFKHEETDAPIRLTRDTLVAERDRRENRNAWLLLGGALLGGYLIHRLTDDGGAGNTS